MNSAVLFLVFNRPETTELAFQAIRAARPPRLYVAADGPRAGRPEEIARCAEVRAIFSGVDWPCEVRTLFREANLGCRLGVSSGIDWFFENEPEGIIIEDDVLPDPSFFRYCDELLERYRDRQEVASISGCNLVEASHAAQDSYFFSRYCHVWGWATWRRAWQHYDLAMTRWPAWESSGGIEREFSEPGTCAFWRETLGEVYHGRIDTWDVQWLFTCWQRDTLCILPGRNLTQNIGFGAGATNTTGTMPAYVRDSQKSPMEFPLRHPGHIERSVTADEAIDRIVFSQPVNRSLRAGLRSLAKRLTRTLAR